MDSVTSPLFRVSVKTISGEKYLIEISPEVRLIEVILFIATQFHLCDDQLLH